MNSQFAIQVFSFGSKRIEILVPERPQELTYFHSPYWAKIWPASIGLCSFLQNNLHYIGQKKVLELAAGLGLTGIFAAHYASSVCISDIEPQAVALMEQSVQLNKLNNVQCRIIDWSQLANVETPDVLLLSDINYEPTAFDTLFTTLKKFLDQECTIILSTPQRLMAKEFISKMLPWCIQQDEIVVDKSTAISVFVLTKPLY